MEYDVPPIALSLRAHDRVAEHRVDDEWLAQAWADPDTRVLVVAGSRFVVDGDTVPWVPTDQAPEGIRVLLGQRDTAQRDGAVRFAVVADRVLADTDPPAGRWTALRGALPIVHNTDAELLVHALGIAEWLEATRFCPRCGGGLEPTHAGHELHCTGVCGRSQFPRTDPAVIMAVIDGEAPHDRILMGRNPSWPPGRYSTLAGFVEPGESMEQAVRREVLEETGVRVGEVTYIGSQPWPLPASLMVGFLARAESTEVVVDGEEIEDARWFTREQVAEGSRTRELLLPGGISISHALLETWFGGPLPGGW
ncbi:NAD(+) diphosphatase [Nocardioides mangrovicus]|uniref:NAD(+) diphosphatase n=1 Tax=Nocardioides mangrovicus TaxID=2478913 RepID=A0A3L8P8N8_9ACTN|nr:NAD(+) diphosphatase [Nocardioides mangrovicus]RLV51263.1 NAD(+) diphosphatase [Nocardioides mangrovicus]